MLASIAEREQFRMKFKFDFEIMIRQMLKNWRKQGLVVQEEDGNYRKL